MKKVKLILLFTIWFCGLNYSDAQNSLPEIKKRLIGRWVLVNDKNFVMDIQKDSIIYCYKQKVTDRKPITFLFGDSIPYYKQKNDDFDFLKSNGDIYPGIIIKEYDLPEKTTTKTIIIYISKTGMNLTSGGRTATFKKMK